MATIRLATVVDLPSIHDLIRQSYGAMGDHYPDLLAMFTKGANEAIESGDLNETTFEACLPSMGLFNLQLQLFSQRL